MATRSSRSAASQSTDVAPVQSAQIPAALLGKMQSAAGRGLSTSQSDNQTPIVRVLQSGSPQVKKQTEAYIEGAEPGKIWLRNAGEFELVDGETGFDFQPCHYQKSAIEWIPRSRGGGFVGRTVFKPGEEFEDVARRLGAQREEVEDENTGRKTPKWKLPNGNELVETRSFSGWAELGESGEVMPFVISYSKSGLSVAREWMSCMNRKRVPGENGQKLKADIYFCKYHMTTKFRQNASGDWFSLVPDQGRWVQTEEELDRGQQLYEDFESGGRVVEDDIGEGQEEVHADSSAEAAGL